MKRYVGYAGFCVVEDSRVPKGEIRPADPNRPWWERPDFQEIVRAHTQCRPRRRASAPEGDSSPQARQHEG